MCGLLLRLEKTEGNSPCASNSPGSIEKDQEEVNEAEDDNEGAIQRIAEARQARAENGEKK